MPEQPKHIAIKMAEVNACQFQCFRIYLQSLGSCGHHTRRFPRFLHAKNVNLLYFESLILVPEDCVDRTHFCALR